MATANTNHEQKPENDQLNANSKSAYQLRNKAFRIALEMVGIFGGPAVIAIILGGWLEARYKWPASTTYILLAVAFVLSWSIVIVRVRSYARDIETGKQQSKDTDDTNAKSNVQPE